MLLLTGLPRSGTSWAAGALRAAQGGELCFEPCNWKGHPEMATWHLRYLPAADPDPTFTRLVFGVRDVGYSTVKEVHTPLAVEQWDQVTSRVVILVRHPLAMAASWKSLGYEIDFRLDLLAGQPSLMADHLGPYLDDLRGRRSWFRDAGVLWGACYLVLERLTSAHPDWCWTTHEMLCADPVTEFARVLGDDTWDRAALSEFLHEHDRADAPGEPYAVTRRTAAQPDRWRKLLTGPEVDEVLAGAASFGILERLYPSSPTARS